MTEPTGIPGVTVYPEDDNSGQIEVTVGPTIVHQGRYRLYAKPDGGLHLVYQREDTTEPDHMEIPGKLIFIFNAVSEGKMSLGEMMREVMKLRGTM